MFQMISYNCSIAKKKLVSLLLVSWLPKLKNVKQNNDKKSVNEDINCPYRCVIYDIIIYYYLFYVTV